MGRSRGRLHRAITISATIRADGRRSFQLEAVHLSVVGDRGLTLGHLHLLRWVRGASLRPFRRDKTDRVRIHLSGRDDLGRGRVPGWTLGALHVRAQVGVEVLNGVFDTALGNKLDAPSNGSVGIGPTKLDVGRLCILKVGRTIAVLSADAGAFSVAPDELPRHLTIEGNRALVSADSGVLKPGSRPPRTADVLLVGIGCGYLSHLTGQRRLIGVALTNDRPVIESEGETSIPGKWGLAIVRHGRDSERLSDSQLIHGPGTSHVDLTRGLSRRGRCLGDLGLDLRGGVGSVGCCRGSHQ